MLHQVRSTETSRKEKGKRQKIKVKAGGAFFLLPFSFCLCIDVIMPARFSSRKL
jgi:hypothetical protein